jgi:rare lipoprotein A
MKSAASRLAITLAAWSVPAIALAQPISGPAADYPMVLGDPFVVDGVTYTPTDRLNYDAVGYAVPDAEGGGGISGAHRTAPLPSYVEVTALDSGRTILVRLERRGPMQGDGLVALSRGAMAQLGLTGTHAPVRVRRVNPPEVERALLRSGQQAPARMDTPPGLLAALKRKLGILPPVDPRPETLAAALAGGAPVPPAPAPKPVMTKPVMAKPATPVPAAAQAKPIVRNTTPMPAPQPPVPKPPVPKPAVPKAPDPKPLPPKPEPKPAPKAEAKPAAKPAALAVQVGAFSTRANADKAAREVGGAVVPSGKFFRVRIAASSTAEATAALAKAKRAGYADAQIQHTP